jgi:hypothetical protein
MEPSLISRADEDKLFSSFPLCGRDAYNEYISLTDAEKERRYPGDKSQYFGTMISWEKELHSMWGRTDLEVSKSFNLFDDEWLTHLCEHQRTLAEHRYDRRVAENKSLFSGLNYVEPPVFAEVLESDLDELDPDKIFNGKEIALDAPFRLKRIITKHVRPNNLHYVLLVSLALHERYITDVNTLITSNDGKKGILYTS